jgi:hypothetical protein
MIGLPSLHALDHSQGPRIWLAADATDMRCGFDRLAERVKAVIGQDPVGNSLFKCPLDCTRCARRRLSGSNHTSVSPALWQAI